jgi:hypothetical protein
MAITTLYILKLHLHGHSLTSRMSTAKEADLLNRSSGLAAALGVAEFTARAHT